MIRPNSKDNLFLPANDALNGEFRNEDANYLMGCVEIRPVLRPGAPALRGSSGELSAGRRTKELTVWARLAGVLPSTAGGVYSEPYVGDPSSYDVRYVSISSTNRSPPSAVYKTVKDSEIREHFGSAGEYVIWFGEDESQMPLEALQENAMFMPWPRETRDTEAWPRETKVVENETGEVAMGRLAPFAGILYREILSQVSAPPAKGFHRDKCEKGSIVEHAVFFSLCLNAFSPFLSMFSHSLYLSL